MYSHGRRQLVHDQHCKPHAHPSHLNLELGMGGENGPKKVHFLLLSKVTSATMATYKGT